jgi:hypothetical protein
MPTYRKLKRAEYEQDAGQTHHTEDKRTGKITVFYSNGRRQEFEHISRRDFFEWEARHFDYRRPPSGVKTLPPDIQPEPEEIEAALEEKEAEYQAMRERRRKIFKMANLALEKQIGTEQYRKLYGKPPSEDEEPDPKKRISPFSPDNPRWKKLNELVRANLGDAEYQKRFGVRK